MIPRLSKEVGKEVGKVAGDLQGYSGDPIQIGCSRHMSSRSTQRAYLVYLTLDSVLVEF